MRVNKNGQWIMKGVLRFAYLNKLNKDGVFSCAITTTDEKLIAELESVGIKVKDFENGEPGECIVNMKSNYEPNILTPADDFEGIANDGDLVDVTVKPYGWKHGRQTGVSLSLNGVKVLKREVVKIEKKDAGSYFEGEEVDISELPFN